MKDIYNFLVQHDFSRKDDSELSNLINSTQDAHTSLLIGLRAIGNLAFWAVDGENYPDSQARDDLRDLGSMLMHLPRIAEALNDTAISADYEKKRREHKDIKNV